MSINPKSEQFHQCKKVKLIAKEVELSVAQSICIIKEGSACSVIVSMIRGNLLCLGVVLPFAENVHALCS